MNPLKAHTERIRDQVRALDQQLTWPGEDSTRRPAALRFGLRSLIERTERPEVRVLILGPLKAGKSTLMNVLLNNPRVSQISQLPAYPCFVEVRDVERDSEGEAVGRERTIFYPSDGGSPEVFTVEDGMRKLDVLLDEYIAAGDTATIAYSRVEQRIDLSASGRSVDLEGLDLILIDSPGLFFHKRIDREVFHFDGDTAGETEGSPTMREFYASSDVVIFTLRWEQLFFHLFADYLRRFRADLAGFRNLRTFILVNASSHSLTQEDGEIHGFDQVAEENQKKLRSYFEKHVGDEELIAALRQGDRMSLHFCDLLDVARSLFAPEEAEPGTPGHSNSVEAIHAVRSDIFDRGLPARKIEDLNRLWRQTLDQALIYLESCRREQQEGLEETKREAARLGEQVAAFGKEAGAWEAQYDNAAGEASTLVRRLDIVWRRDFRPAGLDGVLAAWRLLRERLLDVEVEELPSDATVRQQVASGYRHWRDRQEPPPRLADLPGVLWSYKEDPERESLAGHYKTACAQVLASFERAARDLLTEPELLSVIDRFGADDIPWPDGMPEPLRQNLPLLEFRPRRGGGWSRWSLWPPSIVTAFDARHLWGADGMREILPEQEHVLLEDEEENFLTQIWAGPWRFADCFQPGQLKRRLLGAFEEHFCHVWGGEIERRLREKQDLAERLRVQLRDARTRLEDLRARIEECERRHEEQTARLEDLSRRKEATTALEPALP